MIPERELGDLQRVRIRTLALVDGLAQDGFDRRPADGGWSVGEILDHLLRAEAANRGTIRELVERALAGQAPYLRRSLTPGGLAPAFFPRPLLPLVSLPMEVATLFVPFSVREWMVRNRVLPASASDELRPQPGRPAGALRHDLVRSLAETRELFAAHPDLDYGRMTYQHPFLGANDVPRILRLTAAHEERHQDQIRVALGAGSQP